MTHEFDGKKYAKASAHQNEWGTRLIAELHLRGNERILDLGCGDGALTSRLALLVPEGEVLGIDASRGMIGAASPKAGSNLRFRRLDINELDFEDEFDVVFSNATLHWVKDHRRLLRNVRRALRPGGRLRFNFAGEGNCSRLCSAINEAMSRDEYRQLFEDFEWPWYMPGPDDYRLLAESSRFGMVRVWGENADRFFPDQAAMIGWIDQPGLVPFLANLSAEAKRSFRNFVVSRMIEETKRENGTCFETFRRINVSASVGR